MGKDKKVLGKKARRVYPGGEQQLKADTRKQLDRYKATKAKVRQTKKR